MKGTCERRGKGKKKRGTFQKSRWNAEKKSGGKKMV
jgi:hypothetical protein